MTADLCQFGSWCPKATHARTLCREPAVGTSIAQGSTQLRLCAHHGTIFQSYGKFYGGTFTPDAQQPESQLQLNIA